MRNSTRLAYRAPSGTCLRLEDFYRYIAQGDPSQSPSIESHLAM